MEGDNIPATNNEAVISKQIFDDQNAKITNLEQQYFDLQEKHLSTLQVNESLQQKIEEMEQASNKQLKAVSAKVSKVPAESFKVGKIEYVFTVPAFHYGGNKITSTQALQDKDILADLVKQGSGVIKRKGA